MDKPYLLKKNIYLFICLHQVLVEAHGIFVAVCRIFIVAYEIFFFFNERSNFIRWTHLFDTLNQAKKNICAA